MPSIAYIRLALILLFSVLGLLLHYKLGLGSAWYLYLTSIILLLAHFLFGTVWAAFSQLKKGNINEAENLLHYIKRPHWLLKTHKAYYHFVKGMIAIQRNDTTGQQDLKEALQLGLRNSNDNALAALRIAHANFMDKSYADAQSYLKKAQSYNSDDLMIKENLGKLESALQRELN